MRVIVAHSGVSRIMNEEKCNKRIKTSQNAVKNGIKAKECVEAVEKTVNFLENSGTVNAGLGSVSQHLSHCGRFQSHGGDL